MEWNFTGYSEIIFHFFHWYNQVRDGLPQRVGQETNESEYRDDKANHQWKLKGLGFWNYPEEGTVKPENFFFSNVPPPKQTYLPQAANYTSSDPVWWLVGFPDGSVVKNLPTNAGDVGSIPGSERSPAEVNVNLLQSSHLKNPMDWQAAVKRVTWEGHKESDTHTHKSEWQVTHTHAGHPHRTYTHSERQVTQRATEIFTASKQGSVLITA